MAETEDELKSLKYLEILFHNQMVSCKYREADETWTRYFALKDKIRRRIITDELQKQREVVKETTSH